MCLATVRIVESETRPHQVAVSAVSCANLGRLRDSFERDHHVKLPEFLSVELLYRTRRYMDEGKFSTRVHKGIGTELSLEQGKSPALLLFLLNDPELFEIVRAITGCDRIGLFNGRIYRMMPREHADSWHDDVDGKRLIAMSINRAQTPTPGARSSSGTNRRRRSWPASGTLVQAMRFSSGSPPDSSTGSQR